MRIAALVIGIFGAMAGFAGALFAMVVGGIGEAFGADEGSSVAILGFVALVASIVGLVGAALALAKPRVAGGLMGVSAVVGLIATSLAYALATVLLLVAALLAFLGRREKQDSA